MYSYLRLPPINRCRYHRVRCRRRRRRPFNCFRHNRPCCRRRCRDTASPCLCPQVYLRETDRNSNSHQCYPRRRRNRCSRHQLQALGTSNGQNTRLGGKGHTRSAVAKADPGAAGLSVDGSLSPTLSKEPRHVGTTHTVWALRST